MGLHSLQVAKYAEDHDVASHMYRENSLPEHISYLFLFPEVLQCHYNNNIIATIVNRIQHMIQSNVAFMNSHNVYYTSMVDFDVIHVEKTSFLLFNVHEF